MKICSVPKFPQKEQIIKNPNKNKFNPKNRRITGN
jgi:hypothetical protein